MRKRDAYVTIGRLLSATDGPKKHHDRDGDRDFHEGGHTLNLLPISHSRNYSNNGATTSLSISRLSDAESGFPKPRKSRQREIGINFLCNSGGKTACELQHCSERDHCCVIGTQPRLGAPEFQARVSAGLPQLCSQGGVTADAAADRDKIDIVLLPCRDRFAHENVNDRLLK